MPPLYTEPGWQMHTGAEIGIDDDFQSQRSPDGRYRTTPLKGLFARKKGGFYHDGRFADYAAVIRHYDGFLRLGLEDREKADPGRVPQVVVTESPGAPASLRAHLGPHNSGTVCVVHA